MTKRKVFTLYQLLTAYLRIISLVVDDIEQVVVDSREVVSVQVSRDDSPPPQVQQTSHKLPSTVTLWQTWIH